MKRMFTLILLLIIIMSTPISATTNLNVDLTSSLTPQGLQLIESSALHYSNMDLSPEEINYIEYLQHDKPLSYGYVGDLSPVYWYLFKQLEYTYDIHFKSIPFSNETAMLNALKNDEIDIITPVPYSHDNSSYLQYSNPIIQSNVIAYYLYSEDLSHLLTSNKINIGVLDSFIYTDYINSSFPHINVNIIKYDTVSDLKNSLINKKVDFILSDINNYNYIISNSIIYGTDISKILPTPGMSIATKKGSHDSFINLVDKSFSNLPVYNNFNIFISSYIKQSRLRSEFLRANEINFDFDKIYKILYTEKSTNKSDLLVNTEDETLLINLLINSLNSFDLNYKLSDSSSILEHITTLGEARLKIENENFNLVTPVPYSPEYNNKYNSIFISNPIGSVEFVVITKDYMRDSSINSITDISTLSFGYYDNTLSNYILGQSKIVNKSNITKYSSMYDIINDINNEDIFFALVPFDLYQHYILTNTQHSTAILNSIEPINIYISFMCSNNNDDKFLTLILSEIIDISKKDDIFIYSYAVDIFDLYESFTSFTTNHAKTISLSGFVLICFAYVQFRTYKLYNTTDALTGLLTDDHLLKLLNKKNKLKYVIYLEISNLHLIDKHYGYSTSDKILTEVSKELTEYLKPNNVFKSHVNKFLIYTDDYNFNLSDLINKITKKTHHINEYNINIQIKTAKVDSKKILLEKENNIINILEYLADEHSKNPDDVIEITDDVIIAYKKKLYPVNTFVDFNLNNRLVTYINPIKNTISSSNNYTIGGIVTKKWYYDDVTLSIKDLTHDYLYNNVIYKNFKYSVLKEIIAFKDNANKYPYDSVFIYDYEPSMQIEFNMEEYTDILTLHNLSLDSIYLRLNKYDDIYLYHNMIKENPYLNDIPITVNESQLTSKSLLYLHNINVSLLEIDLKNYSYILHSLKNNKNFDLNYFKNDKSIKFLLSNIKNFNCNILANTDYSTEELKFINFIKSLSRVDVIVYKEDEFLYNISFSESLYYSAENIKNDPFVN